MRQKATYTLSIMRDTETGVKHAKQITMPATAKSLEKMLYMIEKMKWAKAKMIGYIFKDSGPSDYSYQDIVYIVNRNYNK